MLMKTFALSGLLALGLSPLQAASPVAALTPTAVPLSTPVLAAAPVSPSAKAPSTPAMTPVVAPVAPVSVSPSAAPVTPALSGTAGTLGAAVSPTADAEGDSLVAEEVGEDGSLLVKTESPDLLKLDSETLAALASGVDPDNQDIYFDAAAKQPLAEAAAGAWKVDVNALYYELARRTLGDATDKSARQALALALFKDAERAKAAKDLAFDDKVASTVIAQLEGGRAKSKADLQALAEKGNRKARLYLGLDQPLVPVAAPSATTPTAASPLSPTTTMPATAVPSAVSPSATPQK